MHLGLLVAVPGRNIDKSISDIASLVENYEGKLIFWLKTYYEIRILEMNQEEILNEERPQK